MRHLAAILALGVCGLAAAQENGAFPPRLARDDADKDGKVTREEFTGPPQLFQRLDRNQDGAITAGEVGRRRQQDDGPRPYTVAPTHADVAYGPDPRNVLDFWQARGDGPAPLLVWIHGGGFRNGDKSNVSPAILRALPEAGIAVASISYRLSGTAPAPAQFLDAARAVQFLRTKAVEWGVDPERFAAAGGSAGAGLSQWLGFHDDLADPDNADPVLRQSTRLRCLCVINGQTTYDPRAIRELVPGRAWQDSALPQLFDFDIAELDSLPPEKYALFAECSPMTHIGPGDPPILMLYGGSADPAEAEESGGKGIHHPLFGLALKEKMDALGIPCTVKTETRIDPALLLDFLRQHL